jgi:Rieske Fe-S protein
MHSPVSKNGPWTRRRWVKHFMLGSAAALGVGQTWRARLLADISPGTPPSDILPISLTDFPDLMNGNTPSIQLQLSYPNEVIMINRAPYNGFFYVLDSRCTHQGCIVGQWDIDEGIVCPCHGSMYNIDGSLVYGAAGPMQPGLATYNFSYDGANLLQIQVPGLNLKINSVAVQTRTASNTRLHLSFPVRVGSSYQVASSMNLQDWSSPVYFSTTATGNADTQSVTAVTADPLDVWVDNAGAYQAFYRIEVILTDYNE